MLTGVGPDLGAINRQRTESNQFRFLGDPDHLNKYGLERSQVLLAKIADSAVSGEIASRQDPKGDIFFQLPGDLS